MADNDKTRDTLNVKLAIIVFIFLLFLGIFVFVFEMQLNKMNVRGQRAEKRSCPKTQLEGFGRDCLSSTTPVGVLGTSRTLRFFPETNTILAVFFCFGLVLSVRPFCIILELLMFILKIFGFFFFHPYLGTISHKIMQQAERFFLSSSSVIHLCVVYAVSSSVSGQANE